MNLTRRWLVWQHANTTEAKPSSIEYVTFSLSSYHAITLTFISHSLCICLSLFLSFLSFSVLSFPLFSFYLCSFFPLFSFSLSLTLFSLPFFIFSLTISPLFLYFLSLSLSHYIPSLSLFTLSLFPLSFFILSLTLSPLFLYFLSHSSPSLSLFPLSYPSSLLLLSLFSFSLSLCTSLSLLSLHLWPLSLVFSISTSLFLQQPDSLSPSRAFAIERETRQTGNVPAHTDVINTHPDFPLSYTATLSWKVEVGKQKVDSSRCVSRDSLIVRGIFLHCMASLGVDSFCVLFYLAAKRISIKCVSFLFLFFLSFMHIYVDFRDSPSLL